MAVTEEDTSVMGRTGKRTARRTGTGKKASGNSKGGTDIAGTAATKCDAANVGRSPGFRFPLLNEAADERDRSCGRVGAPFIEITRFALLGVFA